LQITTAKVTLIICYWLVELAAKEEQASYLVVETRSSSSKFFNPD
jgi:hypothetical protein